MDPLIEALISLLEHPEYVKANLASYLFLIAIEELSAKNLQNDEQFVLPQQFIKVIEDFSISPH